MRRGYSRSLATKLGMSLGNWLQRREGRVKIWSWPSSLADLLASVAGLAARLPGSQEMPAGAGSWNIKMSWEDGWRGRSAWHAGGGGKKSTASGRSATELGLRLGIGFQGKNEEGDLLQSVCLLPSKMTILHWEVFFLRGGVIKKNSTFLLSGF